MLQHPGSLMQFAHRKKPEGIFVYWFSQRRAAPRGFAVLMLNLGSGLVVFGTLSPILGKDHPEGLYKLRTS